MSDREQPEERLKNMMSDRERQQGLQVTIKKAEERIKWIDKRLSTKGLSPEEKEKLQKERAETFEKESEAEQEIERIDTGGREKITRRFSDKEIGEIQSYIREQISQEKILEKIHKEADDLVRYLFREGKDLISDIQKEADKTQYELLRGEIRIKPDMSLHTAEERKWASDLLDAGKWGYFQNRFLERLNEEIEKKNMDIDSKQRFKKLLRSVLVEVGTSGGGYEYVFAHKDRVKAGEAEAVPQLDETIRQKLLPSQRDAIEGAIARGELDVDVRKFLMPEYDEKLNEAMVSEAMRTEQEMKPAHKKRRLEQVGEKISNLTNFLSDVKAKVSHQDLIVGWFRQEDEFKKQKEKEEGLQAEMDNQETALASLKAKGGFLRSFIGKPFDKFNPKNYASPDKAGEIIRKIENFKDAVQTAKNAKEAASKECKRIAKELGLSEGKSPEGSLNEAEAVYKTLIEQQKSLQAQLEETNKLKSEYEAGRELFAKESA